MIVPLDNFSFFQGATSTPQVWTFKDNLHPPVPMSDQDYDKLVATVYRDYKDTIDNCIDILQGRGRTKAYVAHTFTQVHSMGAYDNTKQPKQDEKIIHSTSNDISMDSDYGLDESSSIASQSHARVQHDHSYSDQIQAINIDMLDMLFPSPHKIHNIN